MAKEQSTVCADQNTEFTKCTNLCPFNCVLDRPLCFSLRCGPPGCQCKPDHIYLSSTKEGGCVLPENCLKTNKNKKA